MIMQFIFIKKWKKVYKTEIIIGWNYSKFYIKLYKSFYLLILFYINK